jgi:hypothetical protein
MLVATAATKHRYFSGRFATILGIALSFTCQNSVAVDCGACRTLGASIQAQKNAEKTHLDLLERNRAFLASVNAKKDLSKAIKVKSNILVLVLRLETFKNNLLQMETEYRTKGCGQCPAQ